MLSNPAVGNGSQKFKRKLTNKHVKGHTNTGAGQGTHCPGLKTPKPGNQKHQHRSWARKTAIQELKTHRPGGENSGKGKHQEWEPKKPTQKAGRKNTNPGTGNTKTWEPETPREPKKPIWEKETPREGKAPIWELKTPNQRNYVLQNQTVLLQLGAKRQRSGGIQPGRLRFSSAKLSKQKQLQLSYRLVFSL